jgi:hypothetical protein
MFVRYRWQKKSFTAVPAQRVPRYSPAGTAPTGFDTLQPDAGDAVRNLPIDNPFEATAGHPRAALAEREPSADALSLQAKLLDRDGHWDASVACLRAAHALSPADPQARLNLAMALLRRGEYREGFALYEARIDKPGWSGLATRESRAALRHLMLQPGQPVEGRNILVLAEQGLGDGIMFARYIGSLLKRGARVAVACNAVIRPFFERIAGIHTILSPPSHAPFAQINLSALRFDAWVPMLSLPSCCGSFEEVDGGTPYWSPDRSRVAAWRDQFAGRGRPGATKVGLVFQANPDGASFADKSMTADDLLPLLSLEAIDFVNLQHGSPGKSLAAAAPGIIHPFPDGAPLDEYAAAMAATDLVISVDTMAAHCAGAMGHATWLAVPHSPHWAWGLNGGSTAWYPSIRMFRQARRRSWSAVIEAMAAELGQPKRKWLTHEKQLEPVS